MRTIDLTDEEVPIPKRRKISIEEFYLEGRKSNIEIENGWIIYNSFKATISIEEFISQYNPLHISSSLFSWVAVKGPNYYNEDCPDIPSLLNEWENSDEPKNQEFLDKLSRKYQVLVGKWMIFVKPEEISSVWGKVSKDVVEGNLGSLAKISTGSEKSHVICIYTKDHTDQLDVLRVRTRLEELGFNKKLNYKPDTYTYCNIYAKNPWNIAPIKYSM